jgi:hypothetical protein
LRGIRFLEKHFETQPRPLRDCHSSAQNPGNVPGFLSMHSVTLGRGILPTRLWLG